ncbi:ABC-2 type transport system permease protein [Chitinophaga costaii]|uniref:ABC-2 type transport system permease protein n=1 Tax=Chitinophaga costaii TaxID=1335309 RepID=A0A1C4E1B9_9BACT|nr:Gldg family protein [Chitinophaga costaii]PUZ24375.1 ABC transporter [Chitinophaga costaii]SCC37406.1 ABC-2 type transport system permease protein [Chitinophaga costaii]
MKTIYNIARAELKVLFYSPVAWLILIVFTFQVANSFCGIFGGDINVQHMGYPLNDATMSLYGGIFGVFTQVLKYMYLYIPLLTMSIMSREYSTGSIKLLYSSPLSNVQIILGKYLSLMIFGLAIIAILLVFGVFGMLTIDHADTPVILSGLLGIYLLICAYAAIGLFMSSLTAYNIVSALGTFLILGLLGWINGVGQDINFVRDITYWMAMSGRSGSFVDGMITSEDILYFIIVICLFLAFTIIKLQSARQRTSRLANFARYAGAFIVAVLLGYCSAKPAMKFYADVTRTKVNTLTKSSQEVMQKLTGDFTIHTYVNMLDGNYFLGMPGGYKTNEKMFDQYIRFKPDLKIDYTYYYKQVPNEVYDRMFKKLNEKQRIDTLIRMNKWRFNIVPYNAISSTVDLKSEDYRFVRVLERGNGKKTFLRVYDDMMRNPFESQITAAIKRLVTDLPVVGFVAGHGERESNGATDRGYSIVAQDKSFRYSLINNGFDFKDVLLDKPVPDNIRLLVIAEPKKSYTPEELTNLNDYIKKGGNMFILGEPGRQEQMNAITTQLGVHFEPGILVKPSKTNDASLLAMKPNKAAMAFSYQLADMQKREMMVTMPTAGGLTYENDKGFNITPLFCSDTTGAWNELQTTNFVDDTASLDPATGEKEGSYPVVLTMSRKVGHNEQRIMVTGDADWLSNGELSMNRKDLRSGNFSLITAAFFWLSNNEVPIDMKRDTPPDQSVRVGEGAWNIIEPLLKWLFPAALLLCSILIWVRRRGR